MGWRYEWIDALPVDVYNILVEEFLAEHTKRQESF